ncbi:MFS quinate transporter [Drechmeria coniospora]|uniref:MFS quinate transporter n=1 Tax=Drechmeria coniospora TaxID=98403 RepID=A0A151GK92_DRECN|nr:MFS quinate transporter [Drechmeria coniospora]KYK57525.1 MFS quinate transporter [Drechmeria coniospora]ODA79412.1 hypothetical protein RJ55_05005 [Drechmeria coniospora]
MARSWFRTVGLGNLHYFLTVMVVACGSIPKGYDEGGFAAASGLTSFLDDFHLGRGRRTGDSSHMGTQKAVIASLGVLGAAVGALVSIGVTDRIGRLRAWQLFTLLWITGFLTLTFSSGHLSLLMFARVWGGVGAGGLTVVSPLYLSEIAKSKSRGMVVSMYMVILLSFLMAGFFINYAVVRTMAPSRRQYRVVLGVVQIPVGLALFASCFLHDTPRWLLYKQRRAEAVMVLAKLRGRAVDDPDVARELDEIERQMADTKQLLAGVSTWTVVKEVATVRSYRQRFLLGMAMQAVAQWSGGNGISYYIPEIFRLAGVKSSKNSLVSAGGYGAVKLVFTMVFTWALIDHFGRRRCFLTGLGLQCASHLYMALYMGLWRFSHNKPASDAAVASVFVYAMAWSIGLCTIQYLYGTEILPTRIRSVCYATNMALHWLWQFLIVRVTPPMFNALDVWGAYAFWAFVCLVGLVVLGLWAPETKGVPMERMGELFDGPWYRGWRAKLQDADDELAPRQRIRSTGAPSDDTQVEEPVKPVTC